MVDYTPWLVKKIQRESRCRRELSLYEIRWQNTRAPLEQDRRQQGRQTGVGDEVLRKAAVKTTWGREHIKIVISVTCLSDVSQGTHEEIRQIDIFVSLRTGA